MRENEKEKILRNCQYEGRGQRRIGRQARPREGYSGKKREIR